MSYGIQIATIIRLYNSKVMNAVSPSNYLNAFQMLKYNCHVRITILLSIAATLFLAESSNFHFFYKLIITSFMLLQHICYYTFLNTVKHI